MWFEIATIGISLAGLAFAYLEYRDRQKPKEDRSHDATDLPPKPEDQSKV